MIYIACLPYFATGGTELLHQFCAELIKQGGEACILYHKAKNDPVAERFKKYKVPYITDVNKLNETDILVVPEVLTDLLYEWSGGRKVIWWLSVDFFFKSRYSKRNLYRKYILGKKFYNFDDGNVVHYVQSRYANDFLLKRKIQPKGYLSDYLGEEFIKDAVKVSNEKFNRNPIVLYNPKKGLKFTEKIIDLCPDIKFRAIENMSPAEVSSLMQTSVLYIDFGNHPGKDRIPREAAISGCCLIVGKQGSAVNSEDISIHESLKFDIGNQSLREAAERIRDVIVNPGYYNELLTEYRRKIVNEEYVFKIQVKKFLSDLE
jgi:hypothetical protein